MLTVLITASSSAAVVIDFIGRIDIIGVICTAVIVAGIIVIAVVAVRDVVTVIIFQDSRVIDILGRHRHRCFFHSDVMML